MPHQRSRTLLDLLIKRLRLWPVIGVIGPRQCGKSTLLRDLFSPKTSSHYVTLDSIRQRDRAHASPEGFTERSVGSSPLVIDEIQKAPDLFDAIKLHVDARRRPGTYVISGSTEFSKLTGIRESLTGRMGLLHLYPMTLAELHSLKSQSPFTELKKAKTPTPALISLSQLDHKLERGGMPGLCFLRSGEEFRAACEAWLDTTCHRDLQQVRGRKLEGSLALAVLEAISTLEEPSVPNLARKLRQDARVIQRYLDALQAILVIQKLEPHPAGVGKPHYVLCDSGIAFYLGAPRETLLRTHVLAEALAALENAGAGRPLVRYYRNEKTSRVPIVLDWPTTRGTPRPLAIQILDGESPARRDTASLHAFANRIGSRPMRLLLLSQTRQAYLEDGIEVHPLRSP